MTRFVDDHKHRFGVEPICKHLRFASSTYYAVKAKERRPSARTLHDRAILTEIRRVHKDSLGNYGARKVWLQMRREGFCEPRCRIERLMRADGLSGAIRGGKKRRTTIADENADRPADLVERDFTAQEPNRLWVSDFTYVPAWEATTYVAFVIDVFSRRIVGWRAARSMKTELVLDAIEMALWSRDHEGLPVDGELVHHSDAGSQYTSFAFTTRLIDAEIAPSIGSVGDAYDNALAETTIGLFKAEMIVPRGPWRTVSDVELATLTWVDWYNNRRLHGACGDVPPVEYERAHAMAVSN